jgi:hypothetical protein
MEHTKLMLGAGVVGAAALVAHRRARAAIDPGEPDEGPVVVATIAASVGEVAAAWEAQTDDEAEPVDGGVEYLPAPGERGTEVHARVDPDAGPSGVLSRLRGGSPEQRSRERLRRVKAMVESGEVVTTEGQPSGRGPLGEAVTRAVTRRLRAWSPT